ncbi:MAG TPA: NAD-dependent epimerase/dehydratase family protein [Bacteroidia bacterium]|nr:NAD-dependent epimerase/dehydratase family protein [Bacteroidia bacterium]
MILVTGATGMLGSRLIYDLVLKGYKVRAMRRTDSQLNRVNRYFSAHPELFNSVEWVNGDITDIFSLEDALAGVDTVYRCAARVSFLPSENASMQLSNINGTANVVNLCLEKGIRKLCYVSSIAALGRSGLANMINEDSAWKTSKYNSAYAISKYGGEREVWRGIAEGLDAVIVNPGVIIGAGDWKTDSSMLFRQVKKGLMFYTHGENGFVDVRDVSRIMIQLTESDIVNERFILVSENKTFRGVFDRIADRIGVRRASIYAGPLITSLAWRFEYLKYKLTGSKPVITRETARSARGKNTYDNSKIKKLLGVEFIDINTSIDDASAEFLKNQIY